MHNILLGYLKVYFKSHYLFKVEYLQQERQCMFVLAGFLEAGFHAVPQLLIKLLCLSTRITCTFPNLPSKEAGSR